MWCCKKNSFYEGLRVGDPVLVFASTKLVGRGNTGRVMYVFVIEQKFSVLWYLRQRQYQHRFDSTYDTSTTPWTRNENGGPWHRGDGNDKRQKNGSNDYERDQTRKWVMASKKFRDFSTSPKLLPLHLQHLVHKSQGYCKQTRHTDAEDVIAHYNL
jgi:hypothetical protein